MRIIKQYCEWLQPPPDNTLELIEYAGRVSYKSEDKIAPGSAASFVSKILTQQHESVIEHVSASMLFVTDRGVSHEMVRHRLASYTQESTRYVSSVDTKQTEVSTSDDVIELYESGISILRISELSRGNFTEWEVYKILDSNNIKRRPHGNRGIMYDDFFDVIDTAEKAYLLGIVQSDGSVRKDPSTPQISITQHEDYAWYLHRMVAEFIHPNASSRKDKNCYQIRFSSPRLRDSLVEKGVVPNKSYVQTSDDIDRLWQSVPQSLIPSFLRGFLDGDGGIRFFHQKNPGNTDSCNISWSGNINLLNKIAHWLETSLNYKSHPLKVWGTKNLFRLSVTTPCVGDELVKLMLIGFKWPYGHPAKTSRMIDRVKGEYPFANFGDPKFVVIEPTWINDSPLNKFTWLRSMDSSERAYSTLRLNGATAQEARSVLPNSLKTEIVMTANMREWLHMLRLRTARSAHPQMRDLMLQAASMFKERVPLIFDKI